jgi:hypothetical protein
MVADRRHAGNGHTFAALVEQVQGKLPSFLKQPSIPKVLFGLAPVEALTDRVRVCQAIRDRGLFPPDAGLYLVATAMDYLAEYRSYEGPVARRLSGLGKRMVAVERAHGLGKGQTWEPGKGPDEWEALCREWQRRFDRLTTDTYREFGEEAMAELYERDRAEFDRRYAEGERFFRADEPRNP